MFVRYTFGLLLVVLLTGCATAQKPTTVNQLQIRVGQIESQLDEQSDDVNELKDAVETLVTSVDRLVSSRSSVTSVQRASTKMEESTTKSSSSGSQKILRVPVTAQEVQEALKIAGYYDGAIDGKLGSGSKRAIMAFQKDHDLKSDGIIGQKTWTELKNYLQ